MTHTVNRYKVLCLVLVVWGCCRGHAGAVLSTEGIPMAARMALSKAGELMNQKAYDRAIEQLKVFQARGDSARGDGKDDPRGYHHPMTYYLLGNCYLLKKYYPRAHEAFSQAVARDPGFSEAWLNLGKTCYEQANYAEAARCYATAYEASDRTNPDSLYCSAVAFTMANAYERSLTAFQRLFETYPHRITLQWREHYVHALIGAGQSRRALPLIRQLAGQSSGEVKTKWQEILLYHYLRLDMRTEALSCATELTRSECTRATWWKALAHVQLSNGCAGKALAAFTIYSYLTPLTAEEKKLWADLNLQVDIPVQAAQQYRELLDDHPDEAILRNLIVACRKLNRHREALELLARYAPGTKNADLLMMKADLLYTLERYDEAEETYRQVAQGNPSKAGQAWLMAGYAAWQSDDLNAGRHAFKKAAEDRRHRKAAMMAMRQMGVLK